MRRSSNNSRRSWRTPRGRLPCIGRRPTTAPANLRSKPFISVPFRHAPQHCIRAISAWPRCHLTGNEPVRHAGSQCTWQRSKHGIVLTRQETMDKLGVIVRNNDDNYYISKVCRSDGIVRDDSALGSLRRRGSILHNITRDFMRSHAPVPFGKNM